MNVQLISKIEPLGFPWQTDDPFLFCAYHRDTYPKGNEKMGVDFEALSGRNVGQDFVTKDGWRMYHGRNVPGFPYHPHRGFETITINKEGYVDHTDSLGAAGRFGAGDVQWMTAGKGIQHSEMFPLIYPDKPNPLEIFQIWLNLPKAKKFVEPHFKMLWNEMIPIVLEEDINGRKTTIDLIAGKLKGMEAPVPTPDSWAANTENGVIVATIKMESNAIFQLPSSGAGYNRSLYFYSGSELVIGGQSIKENYRVVINANETCIIRNGDSEAYLLLLQGKPIQEPVAQQGPFVMNTQDEIQQAFADYRKTQFGGWPWPETEQIHPRAKGRFALHADGSEENKD